MKKLFTSALIAIALFTFSQAMAQKEGLTSKTATVSKGYTVLNPGEQITIYKYVHKAHSPKEAEKYATKYFFTTKSSFLYNKIIRCFAGTHENKSEKGISAQSHFS